MAMAMAEHPFNGAAESHGTHASKLGTYPIEKMAWVCNTRLIANSRIRQSFLRPKPILQPQSLPLPPEAAFP